MSQQELTGPYIYQPYGIQHRAQWESQRIYGIGGLHLLARIDGLTKDEAGAILDALTSPIPLLQRRSK
jgi:hypothetical protein